MGKTQPGGIYIVGGQTVDANGKPVKDERSKKEKGLGGHP